MMLCSSLHVDRSSPKFLPHPTLLTPILLKFNLGKDLIILMMMRLVKIRVYEKASLVSLFLTVYILGQRSERKESLKQ